MSAGPAARLAEARASGGLQRWSRRTDVPLLVLAGLFLVVFVVPLYQPDTPAPVSAALSVINVLVWLAFTADCRLVACSWSGSRGRP